MAESKEDKIFKVVQTFLGDPPLIIWGSGATIPYELPSMSDLNKKLKASIEGFNADNNNLESELGQDKYQEQIPIIKKIIWDEVSKKDILVLEKIITNDIDSFSGIKTMIEKFTKPHPRILNIVTTNYDRVLEYLMSYYNFSYTDGFNGKVLSEFDENNFKKEHMINLIKVHGSLNWFDVGGDIRFSSFILKGTEPKIIAPGKNKYQDAYEEPYRELIQKSDNLIKDASSFFVIGFGFNDEHLTPKIKAKIKKGTPIVLITKEASYSSYKELEHAEKYIIFEESKSGKTKVIYKESKTIDKVEIELEGDLWQLNNFIRIL